MTGGLSGQQRRWRKETSMDLRGCGTDAWTDISGELNLKYEHSILVKEPGTFLGSLEKDTLDHALQMYLNKVDLEIEKLREGLASKIRVGGCLGVMSGVFLIVILL